jgi:acetyl esterase/lipase
MMKQPIAIAFLVLFAGYAQSAEPPAIELWPDGMPEPKVQTEMPEKVEKGKDGISRRSFVSKPRLLVFEAPAQSRTGAAAIVVPGGGFGILADEHEGSDACKWLNRLGITSFLLVHRCPTNKHDEANAGPVQDAQKAIMLVREQAEKWKIDPKKIGVLGFSAGGQVAAVAATNDPRFPAEKAKVSHKPDFLLLIYPWRIYDEKTKGLRADLKPDNGLPPTFLAQCGDDKGSLPQGSTLLFLELINRKVPAELHVYEKGGHGFGMNPRPNANGPSDWPKRAAEWLALRGLGEKPKSP